jgi:hypothetical protein
MNTHEFAEALDMWKVGQIRAERPMTYAKFRVVWLAVNRRPKPDCPARVLSHLHMVGALIQVCGDDADADDPACWLRVIELAPVLLRRWGRKRTEYLQAWVQSQWPDHVQRADSD